MAVRSIIVVLLCLSLSAEAVRVAMKTNQTESDSSEFWCSDYCLRCKDGSTVWYGRSKSWFRSFINVFTEGILIPFTAIANMYVKATKEEFGHWSGYMPSTGLFCEKVDIIKFGFPYADAREHSPAMLADRNWFGRIALNALKPYDTHYQLKPMYTEEDRLHYVEGCKKVKAAGLAGRAAQLGSALSGICDSPVTHGIYECAQHHMLCGPGGAHYITHADSWEMCQMQRGPQPPPASCPYLP